MLTDPRLANCAAWPEWSASRAYPSQSYRTILPTGEFVFMSCSRIVVNPRAPRSSRSRYRFEWRAKVGDGDRTHEQGRTIASGRSSDECKSAVAVLVKTGAPI